MLWRSTETHSIDFGIQLMGKNCTSGTISARELCQSIKESVQTLLLQHCFSENVINVLESYFKFLIDSKMFGIKLKYSAVVSI